MSGPSLKKPMQEDVRFDTEAIMRRDFCLVVVFQTALLVFLAIIVMDGLAMFATGSAFGGWLFHPLVWTLALSGLTVDGLSFGRTLKGARRNLARKLVLVRYRDEGKDAA